MNIANTYESVVRAAFGDCERREDPLGLADQAVYNHNALTPVGTRLRLGLSYALLKASRYHDQSEALASMSEEALDAHEQLQIDDLIIRSALILLEEDPRG